MSVTYVEDRPVLLGTGGALKNAEAYLTCPFFVIHGDAYLQCDYRRVWETFLESERQALMTVFLNADRWDRSNVRFEGDTILDYDKVRRDPRMQHIDWGLAALQPSALATIPVGEPYDLADLYRYLLSRGQLAGYEVSERFYEIGSVHGLDETRRYLSGTIAGASFPNHTGGSAI
jgi:NDP-sugar pyrophosphorylase family protein